MTVFAGDPLGFVHTHTHRAPKLHNSTQISSINLSYIVDNNEPGLPYGGAPFTTTIGWRSAGNRVKISSGYSEATRGDKRLRE